ncbi:hypothetical protein [Paracraurococcus ruber]|uniref:Uncharacterized protein n=1 Tax=Paracraurococcus ruber TaxID=77675 RepID=A0ABS1CX92_9PROT|nr:hypothetical protein [Paracraurococcus ruber]MBK1659153.1 hypothetical protein [Paracraurococcus ruber]TDG29873.1 hypothetical protein E2C05_16420 [Paracraurococcus ruber]
MIPPTEPEAAGRLRRALEGFRKAQNLLLAAHRQLKGMPSDEVDRFWLAAGARLERHLHLAATEVLAAFKAFSAAGLVAGANDRHMITEAQRLLTEGGR